MDFPTLRIVVRDHIKKALEHYKGNKLQTAKALGITRATLYNKIKALAIDPPPNPEYDERGYRRVGGCLPRNVRPREVAPRGEGRVFPVLTTIRKKLEERR